MSNLRPRRCKLERGSNGYGFHLHGEKGKSGQFIRLVEPDSPAATSGLLAGDRLEFVNGESVEGESHQQVVARIKATVGALELVVADAETAALLQKHGLRCRKEFVTEGIPLPSDPNQDDAKSNGAPVPGEASAVSATMASKGTQEGLRPRLCRLQKGPGGYGFNLHSEKTRQGQFIRAVDDGSPAQRAGLKPQDRIIQVNGVCVVGMQHAEVVTSIKAGGEETSLLVVDPETDAFFKSCNVLPSEEHLTGPLPKPASDYAPGEDEVNRKAAKPKVSVSSSSSSSSSDVSVPADTRSPLPQAERPPAVAPEPVGGLALTMSLAQAKERVHQKRAAKKAPTMDWSKRNELFSNL